MISEIFFTEVTEHKFMQLYFFRTQFSPFPAPLYLFTIRGYADHGGYREFSFRSSCFRIIISNANHRKVNIVDTCATICYCFEELFIFHWQQLDVITGIGIIDKRFKTAIMQLYKPAIGEIDFHHLFPVIATILVEISNLIP